MPKDAQIEVLVVGAGPVGLLTALLSTQNGLRTRIIDQEARTAAQSYACALHPASLAIMERAGLADEIIALGRRVDTVGFYEGSGRCAQATLTEIPTRHPYVVVVPQFLLEELLEKKLRALGVRVEWHHRLRGVKMEAETAVVTVEKLALSGRGYIIPELEMTVESSAQVHAQFVVGADGHNSLMRQELGIGSIQSGAAQLYAVYEIETNEPVEPEMKLVLHPSGLGVLWPLSDKRCRWSFQILPPEAAADFPQKDRNRLIMVEPATAWDSFHHLRRFLTERAPWFQIGIKEILWIAHVQFERQVASHFGKDCCWLAGDAAHQANPAGMQSMNLGLSEAADLAAKFKSILRDHAGMELLRTYEVVHRTEWKRLLGLQASLTPPDNLSRWAAQHYSEIIGNLPATGQDLDLLVQTI